MLLVQKKSVSRTSRHSIRWHGVALCGGTCGQHLIRPVFTFFLCYLRPGGNSDSRFDVGKASGTLTVAQPLNAEQRSNYNLTLEATDGTDTVSTQVRTRDHGVFTEWVRLCGVFVLHA